MSPRAGMRTSSRTRPWPRLCILSSCPRRCPRLLVTVPVYSSGMSQLTRSTGRLFLQIDSAVDGRSDVLLAADGAARYLRQGYESIGAWPLALTGYNHGMAGMRNASRRLGTKDIVQIVRKYRSRTFGFASRNFYVEFLAANAVASNPPRPSPAG